MSILHITKYLVQFEFMNYFLEVLNIGRNHPHLSRTKYMEYILLFYSVESLASTIFPIPQTSSISETIFPVSVECIAFILNRNSVKNQTITVRLCSAARHKYDSLE